MINTIADMEPYLEEYEYDALVELTKNRYISAQSSPAVYLSTSILWSDTPQGHQFWASIYTRLGGT